MIWQSYVFMIVALTFLAHIFASTAARWSNAMPANRMEATDLTDDPQSLPWERATTGEALTRLGFSLTALTAVLPDEANNCELASAQHPPRHWNACPEEFASHVHLYGIAVGILIATIGTGIRVYFSLGIYGRPITSSRPVMAALFLMAVALLVMIVSMAIFFTGGAPEYSAQAVHLCPNYDTKAMCEGQVIKERFGGDPAYHDQLLNIWPCVWNGEASLEDKPCTNPNCGRRLLRNRVTILFEYVAIYYWAVRARGSQVPPASLHAVLSLRTDGCAHCVRTAGVHRVGERAH